MIILEKEFEYNQEVHQLNKYKAFTAKQKIGGKYYFFIITINKVIIELGNANFIDYAKADYGEFYYDTIERFCELNDFIFVEAFSNMSQFNITISRR